jgi:four helix bundle protein
MRFEDLIAWQKSRQLTKRVYEMTRKISFSRDYGLVSQIQRASVSIMSNIAEGHERDGAAEFHRFLHVAKASCAEVRSQLYIAFDAGYLTSDEFSSLLNAAEEVARIIGGLRNAIKKRKTVLSNSRPSSLIPRL